MRHQWHDLHMGMSRIKNIYGRVNGTKIFEEVNSCGAPTIISHDVDNVLVTYNLA
jgi:hypothetical protein